MLHAKVMTADSKVAVVGSSNVDSRSLSHDDEVLMVLFDEELVAELDRHLDDDLTRSTLVEPADWSERGVLQRLRERAAGVVDDLL
jgi:cardiolipin synthase